MASHRSSSCVDHRGRGLGPQELTQRRGFGTTKQGGDSRKTSRGVGDQREGRQQNQTGHSPRQLGPCPAERLWEFRVGPSRFVLPGTGTGEFIHQLPSVLWRGLLPPAELQVHLQLDSIKVSA